MTKQKTAKTYIVRATSKSIYGLNQDYYYRDEQKARKELAELREWFTICKDQSFELCGPYPGGRY